MTITYKKIASISTAALLAMTISAAVVPAANAAPLAAQTVSTVATPVPSDSYTAEVFALVNKERVKAGVRPLMWNPAMAKVSQEWATHLGVVTQSPSFDWATIHRPDAGRTEIPAGSSLYGEIISFNFTPDTIVQWWMNSPGHKAAMLDPAETDIGIGYAAPTTGPYAGWHQVVANLAAYSTTTMPIVSGSSPSAIFVKAGSLNGSLGVATSKETYGLKNAGGFQTFKIGSIYWSSASGAHVLRGAIRNAWLATGAQNSSLGYPTTDEIGGLKNSGVSQSFQGGEIYWTPASGAHIVNGGIRTAWRAVGAQNSYLGYPITDEIGGLRDGGVHQKYQGASIYWSPASGAHVTKGGIQTAWLNIGAQDSRLGYPTSDERSGGTGIVIQDYQGGKVTWTSIRGAVVSYS